LRNREKSKTQRTDYPSCGSDFPDPVAAWQSLVEDPEKRQAYQKQRGKGGLVRVSWDEAAGLIATGVKTVFASNRGQSS
jgi:nitrate reductase alpha subunit